VAEPLAARWLDFEARLQDADFARRWVSLMLGRVVGGAVHESSGGSAEDEDVEVAPWGPGKLHVEQARPGGEHEMAGSGVLDQARLADTLAEIKSYIRRDFTTNSTAHHQS
jgi:hypothetical protein